MNDLFVLVDFRLKSIISPVDLLPINWANVNGLDGLDDDKLKDLKWAGHDYFGWLKFNDPDLNKYEGSDEWLESSKLKIKSLVSMIKREKEGETLTYKGKNLKIDDKTKVSLLFTLSTTKEDEVIMWKFLNGSYQMSGSELKKMVKLTNSHIQECFDVEYEFFEKIDNIQTKQDLLEIDINLSWPNTVLTQEYK
jgi:hypothetical protein